MRLTAKERILLHLLEHVKYLEAVEVPLAITQEGIAEATWVNLPHVVQYVRPLVREGLVRERIAHVRTGRRRRKVYDLTEAGRLAAIRLREAVKSEPIRIREAAQTGNGTVAEALAKAGGRATLLEVVRRTQEEGVVVIESLGAQPAAVTVQRMGDVPRVTHFVGRRQELDAVIDPKGAPVVVVQGVPGIGKTTFGARACELLRGRLNIFWHRVRVWDTPQFVLADLGEFLATLGRPGLRALVARGEIGRVPSALREDLTGSRSFLVFDDAHEASPELLALFRVVRDAIVDANDVRILVLTRRALPFYDRRDVVLGGLVREIHLGGLELSEIAAFLSDHPDSQSLVDACRATGGHPLFMELVRASPTQRMVSKARQDLRRFMEETVYGELSAAERRMMKLACLYRVPMPRDGFLLGAELSHDTFLSLLNRSLITSVGERGFGVHDTIREFFEGVLSDSERKEFEPYAVEMLRDCASKALQAGDLTGSVEYLSNAYRVAPPSSRFEVSEKLGDANERLGDLPSALVAYKEALRVQGSLEAAARIHRKIASALLVRGEIKAVTEELNNAIRALAGEESVERGRIDLLRCQLAGAQEEWEEASEYGRAAMQVFQLLGDLRGQTEVAIELGTIERDSLTGDPRGGQRHLQVALDLSNALGDPQVCATVHLALSHLYAYRFGDAQGAEAQLALAEADPSVFQDVHLHRGLLMLKGWFHLELLADPTAAEGYFAEAMALGRRIYDSSTVTSARYGLAFVSYFRGSVEDARAQFDRCASEYASQGFDGLSVEALAMVAECCLMQGDLEGFRRIVRAFMDPRLARGVEARLPLARVLEGLDAAIRRDEVECNSVFVDALRLTEGSASQWPLAHLVHTFYGVALASMDQAQAAQQHSRKADEFLHEHGLKARLDLKARIERRLEEVIRGAAKSR